MSENQSNVPYIVYESAQARAERTIKRLIAVIVLLIVLLTVTNGIWIWYESQFEDVITTETVTQSAEAEDDGTAIVHNGGDFINGTNESTTNDNKNDKNKN